MGLFNFFKKQQPVENDWTKIMPKEMADAFLSIIKENPQACKSDEIPVGIGDFGITPTNPVPVYGVPNNEVYLQRLRTSGGDKIRWRRVGTTPADNIVGSIDDYEIFNLEGSTIGHIYICPYHWKTSEKAPEGFKVS